MVTVVIITGSLCLLLLPVAAAWVVARRVRRSGSLVRSYVTKEFDVGYKILTAKRSLTDDRYGYRLVLRDRRTGELTRIWFRTVGVRAKIGVCAHPEVEITCVTPDREVAS